MIFNRDRTAVGDLSFYDSKGNPINDVVECDTATGRVIRKMTMHNGCDPERGGAEGETTMNYPAPIWVIPRRVL